MRTFKFFMLIFLLAADVLAVSPFPRERILSARQMDNYLNVDFGNDISTGTALRTTRGAISHCLYAFAQNIKTELKRQNAQMLTQYSEQYSDGKIILLVDALASDTEIIPIIRVHLNTGTRTLVLASHTIDVSLSKSDRTDCTQKLQIVRENFQELMTPVFTQMTEAIGAAREVRMLAYNTNTTAAQQKLATLMSKGNSVSRLAATEKVASQCDSFWPTPNSAAPYCNQIPAHIRVANSILKTEDFE